MKIKLIILFVPLILMSCVYAPAGFAPSTGPLEGDYTVLGRATGEVTYFSLLGIIPFGKPDYSAAIQDAVTKFDGGKKMINVRSTFTTTYVVVGFIHKLEVEGDVIK